MAVGVIIGLAGNQPQLFEFLFKVNDLQGKANEANDSIPLCFSVRRCCSNVSGAFLLLQLEHA
jgi:hypothetical protein